MIKKNRKILIADDDHQNRMWLIDTLMESKENYSIISAKDGSEALELIERSSPELIILDWDMPKINGLDTLKQIKNNEKFKDIPVILFTGINTSSRHLDLALKAGAVEFLRKPAESAELVARVNSIFRIIDCVNELVEKEKQLLDIKLNLQKQKVLALNLEKDRNSVFLKQLRNRISESAKSPKAINQIIKDLDGHLAGDDHWIKLMNQVNIFFDDFFKNILEKHPKLSKSDLRICLFIRLRFSIQEIASQIYITESSVRKSRYRLKIKLGLDKTDDIVSYLNRF